MMRFAEELVAADEIVPGESKPSSPRERQLALHLVEELTGPFDPTKHPDEYRSAVLAAVDEKVEAGEVKRDAAAEDQAAAPAAPSAGAQVIDLAELLSKSIQVANKPGPAKAASRDVPEEKTEKVKAPARKRRATG
jgi:DNA end-binding protein Ku